MDGTAMKHAQLFPLAGVLLIFSINGCVYIDQRSAPELSKQMREIEVRMLARVKTKVCHTNEQCELVTYGFEGCAGREKQLVFSKNGNDTAAIQAEAAAYNEINDKLHRRHDIVANCGETQLEPTSACVKHVCSCVGETCQSN